MLPNPKHPDQDPDDPPIVDPSPPPAVSEPDEAEHILDEGEPEGSNFV